jgi:hypothetical protein
MLHCTAPLALTGTEVWILVSSTTTAVDAARLAFCPTTGRFIALPVGVFTTSGLFPTFTDTGDDVTGFRWATTSDIEAHAEQFTGQNQ